MGLYSKWGFTKIGDPVTQGEGANTCVYSTDRGGVLRSGTATTFDDLPPVPVLNLRPGGANIPSLATFAGNTQLFTFAINDLVYGAQEITHDYAESSNISVHMHWANQGAVTGTRGVKWEVEYSVANAGLYPSGPYSMFPSSTTISHSSTLNSGTANRSHYISPIGTINGAGLKIGSYIVYRLRRIASTSSAPASNPFGIAVGFHYEKNTDGSRTLYTK